MVRLALGAAKTRTVSAVINVKTFFSKGRAGWLLAKYFYWFSDKYNVCIMEFQNRAGGKTGGGGMASWSESNRDRCERLRQPALDTIDLNKGPY